MNKTDKETLIDIELYLASEDPESIAALNGLAQHSSTPLNALVEITRTNDEETLIQCALHSNANVEVFDSVYKRLSALHCSKLARLMPHEAFITKIATHPEWTVRQQLALNEHTNDEVLLRLANDQNLSVKHAAERKLRNK